MTRPQDAARRSARLWLREATHRLHLDLHEHPLYRRLTEPDLTYQELRATAAVTYAAASAVEADRARRQLWPEISLADHLTALERDLGKEPCPAPQPGQAYLTSDAGLLGALYVIHGSAFGAASLAKTIWRAVPSAPGRLSCARHRGLAVPVPAAGCGPAGRFAGACRWGKGSVPHLQTAGRPAIGGAAGLAPPRCRQEYSACARFCLASSLPLRARPGGPGKAALRIRR